MDIFYGSSSEYFDVLETLIRKVDSGEPLRWRSAFAPGHNFLESILNASRKVDCAVFLMSPEDHLLERGTSYLTPRDNLIFEAGIMISALGPENVVLIYPDSQASISVEQGKEPTRQKQLTDLAGITHLRCAHVDPKGSVSQFENALADVPRLVRDHFAKLVRPKPDPLWIEGVFPIYNYLHMEDWHSAFRTAVGRRKIDPPLMYYGPGLAGYWRSLSDSELYRRKDERFEEQHRDLLSSVKISSQPFKAFAL